MSPSKSANQLLLEKFFGAEFEFEPEFPVQKAAQFFDGGVFWDIMFNEDERWLFFIAGTQEPALGFSILEVGIYYDELKVDELPGIGEVLSITSLASKEAPRAPFWITKKGEGRLSLATSL